MIQKKYEKLLKICYLSSKFKSIKFSQSPGPLKIGLGCHLKNKFCEGDITPCIYMWISLYGSIIQITLVPRLRTQKITTTCKGWKSGNSRQKGPTMSQMPSKQQNMLPILPYLKWLSQLQPFSGMEDPLPLLQVITQPQAASENT